MFSMQHTRSPFGSYKDYFLLKGQSSSGKPTEEDGQYQYHGRSSREFLLTLFLTVSVLLNLVLLVYDPVHSRSHLQRSKYAGLEMNLDMKITRNNRSLEDELWSDDRYEAWIGVVALNDSFVKEHKLLPAQPYPWDSTKSLYFIQGFHAMHCIKILRESILETHQGRSWTARYGHITHCLNVLREDIVCHADDFPRYTGPLNDQVGRNTSASGLGAIRRCRDWDQLRKFAIDNTACFKSVPAVPTTLEQYKFCPDGSKPWEKFGY